MRNIEPAWWSKAELLLWQRIQAHDFEPEGQALCFTRRLARDRGWDIGFARRAIDEYRRFCFLAIVAEGEVTPSEEVDEVWHQHLVYSRDYWHRWCAEVLHADLHHDPTRGGHHEHTRFTAQYALTLARYEAYFGPPDPMVWPGSAARFRASPRYRIVNSDNAVVLPLPRLLKHRLRRSLAMLGLGTLLSLVWSAPASALSADPLDWTAEPFLIFYGAVVTLSVCAVFGFRQFWCRQDGSADTQGLGELELAYLAGGPTRAADTIAIGMLSAGAATFNAKGGTLTIDATQAALPTHLEPFRYTLSGEVKRSVLVKTIKDRLYAVQATLMARGLLLGSEPVASLRWVIIGFMAPAVVLGIAKIIVGSSRGKPVGILIALVAATVVGTLVLALQAPIRTEAGTQALFNYRLDHLRALRAPLPEELLIAFALTGAAALAGTAYEAYGTLMKSSDGSGGDGGGGCGGGGCGGCGGG